MLMRGWESLSDSRKNLDSQLDFSFVFFFFLRENEGNVLFPHKTEMIASKIQEKLKTYFS